MPVFWILPDPGNANNNVLIATEYGVWSTDNFSAASPNWVITSNGLARVRVTQLHYRASDNTVVASTHGRGLFTTTLSTSASCGAPTSLASGGITATTATVSWAAVSGAISYEVDYKLSTSSTWTNAATATTSTSVSLSGLSASSVYDWRVRTNCASLSSVYSQAQFTTNPPCGTVSGLTTTNITTSSATLNWSAVSGALNYDVDYKTAIATTWTNAATGTTSLTTNIAGLASGTSYNWRVRANCSAGAGSYTETSFSTTVPAVCNDIYETNETSAQAKTISIGTSITAGIGTATDVDWFKISTGNNNRTNVKITLTNLPADYDVYLYNSSLVQIGAGTNSGTTNESVVYNTNTRKATYYIKVQAKAGAFSTSNCYSLLAQTSSTTWAAPANAANMDITGDNVSGLQVSPNPARQTIFLRFYSANEGEASLKLMTTTGNSVQSNGIQVKKGNNFTRIEVGQLQTGIYLVQVINKELNLSQKVMIIR
jgi:hypothetical protein